MISTKSFRQSQLSCSEAALYASVAANRYSEMKTEHLTLKAFTARIHLSDLRGVRCEFAFSDISVCARVTDSLNVGVKASASPPFCLYSARISLRFRGFLIEPT